jgi:hypothetical protein
MAYQCGTIIKWLSSNRSKAIPMPSSKGPWKWAFEISQPLMEEHICAMAQTLAQFIVLRQHARPLLAQHRLNTFDGTFDTEFEYFFINQNHHHNRMQHRVLGPPQQLAVHSGRSLSAGDAALGQRPLGFQRLQQGIFLTGCS